MNTQFPPSSPLLNNDFEHEDTFSALIQQKHTLKNACNDILIQNDKDNAYITPDPSSSLGDVTVGSDINDQSMLHSEVKSSPSKNNALHQSEFSNKKMKLDKSKSIDVAQPLSVNFKNVINVPLNGDTFKIGRSGMSCSFKLNSSNKLISRVHAEINFEKDLEMISLKCIGFNGINITIPKLINVKHIKEQDYVVSIEEPAETDDEQDELECRILKRTNSFTNFFMLKGESVKIPLIDGIVLDFRGELALLAFNRSIKFESTNTNTLESKPLRKLSTSELTAIVEQKKLQFSTRPTLSEIEKNTGSFTRQASPIPKDFLSNTIIYKRPTPTASPSASPVTLTKSSKIKDSTPTPIPQEKSTTRKILLDVTENIVNIPPSSIEIQKDANLVNPVTTQTPKIKTTEIKRLIIEKPKDRIITQTQTLAIEKLEVDESTSSSKASTSVAYETAKETILDKKDSNHRESSKPPEETSNEEMKKRGRPKKVKKTEEEILKSMPKEDVDEVLSSIPELEDISNLLTNHIAYSRVLQTPFSSLLELNSIKKHSLNKLQLRCLLIHHIDCIGVIFRQGKDAAGKPLDEEYYYVPEKDSDKQRVMLVEDLKGSSSHLRSCRKTHKQYFWKKPKV